LDWIGLGQQKCTYVQFWPTSVDVINSISIKLIIIIKCGYIFKAQLSVSGVHAALWYHCLTAPLHLLTTWRYKVTFINIIIIMNENISRKTKLLTMPIMSLWDTLIANIN